MNIYLRDILLLLLTLAGIGCIVSGWIQLARPDTAWRLNRWGHKLAGLQSERTRTWESGRIYLGVVLLIQGSVALLGVIIIVCLI